MELQRFVDAVRRELAVAAEAGGADARALAERLTSPLESTIRLQLLDALSAAAEEITRDLAPGSVDLRLRGGEPSFVVAPPENLDMDPDPTLESPATIAVDSEDGPTARINFRLSDHLKSRIEEAAGQVGLSVNAWLVRAAAAALESETRMRHTQPTRAPRGSQHYTGWVR